MLYDYRCTFDWCGDFEREFPLGEARPTVRCSQGHLARRVYTMPQVAPSALENKGALVRQIDATEARWDKDMPAYKRMRDRGLHPNHIDGSSRLEDRVDTDTDIAYGHLYSHDGGKERVREALDSVKTLEANGYDHVAKVGEASR